MEIKKTPFSFNVMPELAQSGPKKNSDLWLSNIDLMVEQRYGNTVSGTSSNDHTLLRKNDVQMKKDEEISSHSW